MRRLMNDVEHISMAIDTCFMAYNKFLCPHKHVLGSWSMILWPWQHVSMATEACSMVIEHDSMAMERRSIDREHALWP